MVPFDLKVLAKFGLRSNCSQKIHRCSLARARKIFATARMLVFSFGWNGTLKYGDVHEKLNFLKIQDLRTLTNCQLKHFEIILLIFLQMSAKFKESTQWYKIFLRSNGHSNGCLQYKNVTKQAEGTIGCKMLQLVEPPQFCICCSVLEV